MVNKKDIVMKNWYRTDCENSDDISVKQAYELGFNRAYKLMQTELYSQVKKTVYQITDPECFRNRSVEEVINKKTLSEIYGVDFEISYVDGKPLSVYY